LLLRRKIKTMELDLVQARENYMNLSDEEKEIIRRLMNGPARQVISKVFGPELDAALGSFMLPLAERGRGLAART
jgi:hypothetical protein